MVLVSVAMFYYLNCICGTGGSGYVVCGTGFSVEYGGYEVQITKTPERKTKLNIIA